MLLFEAFSSQPIYNLALYTLTALVLLTLASQFGRYFVLELTTHFRLQYVLAAIACAIVLAAYQSWKFVPIALACALLNAIHLLTYYRKVPSIGPATGMHLRLLQANVLKNNKNYPAVIEVINNCDADIVILQETEEQWREQIEKLHERYKHSQIVLLPEGAGMAMLSRYPFESLELLTLDESTHVAILARVNLGERSVTVLGLHPPAPVSRTRAGYRNQQLREAVLILRDVVGPTILIGDLNTTMWSPYFIDLLRETKLRDSRLGYGLNTSWPVPLPSFLRLAIDHCLVSEGVRVEKVQTGARIGSDHLPVIVDLRL